MALHKTYKIELELTEDQILELRNILKTREYEIHEVYDGYTDEEKINTMKITTEFLSSASPVLRQYRFD